MPKARARTVYCDCFDCLDRPAPSVESEQALAASDAAAQQKPPPKALIIFASGFLRTWAGETSLDAVDLPHIDFAARDGALALLSVRAPSVGQGDPMFTGSPGA